MSSELTALNFLILDLGQLAVLMLLVKILNEVTET
jgi:hypothetical protein